MSIQQGAAAEEYACQYLLKQGFRLVARNYYTRFGEIDLIVCKDNILVFVEVRHRRSANFGGAAMSVTWKKQQKLQKTANYFLLNNRIYRSYVCRFDVIALEGTELELNWIQNAFGY